MSVNYNPFEEAVLQPPAFRSDRVAWAWRISGGALFILAALVIVYMLAGFLQWRTDFQADSLQSANARVMRDMHNPANIASMRGGALQAQR